MNDITLSKIGRLSWNSFLKKLSNDQWLVHSICNSNKPTLNDDELAPKKNQICYEYEQESK
jgi:hypothetical protein